MLKNIWRALAALLCLSLFCLSLFACKSGNNNSSETDAVTDGTAYKYSAGGKVLSAVTYEGGAEVSRIEYDYWPSGSVQTITFTEAGKPVETWNYIYGDDGVTLRSRARSYTEDGIPCSDIYEYDESGILQKLSTYEDNVYCGSYQYTYNEDGEISYSCQTDANDDVINYTENTFNDDGTIHAGYYYEYGSLARYWVNAYENDVIVSVTFYTSKDAVLSQTKYEYNDAGKVSRMLFYDADGTMVSYMESLYNDAGVHYKDIYYKDGQPVYGYNYTEEGISTYFEY